MCDGKSVFDGHIKKKYLFIIKNYFKNMYCKEKPRFCNTLGLRLGVPTLDDIFK